MPAVRPSETHRVGIGPIRGSGCGLRRAASALLLLLIWCAGPAAAGDPEIRVDLQPSVVEVGGSARLQVQLEGISGGEKPEMPTVDGLDVYESGRSTNFSLVNGRFSRSTIYTYELVARRGGDYTIGPVRITADGRAYESQSLTLRVRTRPPPASAQAAPGGEPPSVDDPIGNVSEEVFARVVVDSEEIYRGQQLILRFQLYRREDVPIAGTRDFRPPATPGFWREDLGPEHHRRVGLDGATYVVTELAWALFPTCEGELIIEPAAIVCHVETRSRRRPRDAFSDFFDRDFFGRGLRDQRAIHLRTDPLRVRVRPLPEEGRLAGFTGSVGDYSISASLDAPRGRVGEPLALTVTVRGAGHIQTIGPPVWPVWDGLRDFDSGDAISLEKRDDGVFGEKQFTQVLVPTRTGELQIPPVQFVFFDPLRERYRRLETEPLELHVEAANVPAGGVSRAGGGSIGDGDELLYIRTDLVTTLRPARSGGASAAWLVHLMPLLALGCAAGVRRRRARLDSDPLLARRVGAHRRALADLRVIGVRADPVKVAREVAELFESYLGAWLDRPPRALARSAVAARLEEAGVSAELAGRVTGLLEWSDEVRFAAAGGEDVAVRRSEARELLGELEGALRRGPLGRGL